jgi:hypothetical protein
MAFEFRSGTRHIIPMKLDADTDAITVIGTALTVTGATAGYVQNVDGSADVLVGFGTERSASPSADGDKSIPVDISESSIYEVPPDAGSVTQSLVGKTMDVGADGLTVNIDASSGDDLYCVKVDTVANTLFVQLRAAPAGIV